MMDALCTAEDDVNGRIRRDHEDSHDDDDWLIIYYHSGVSSN